jgi:D-hydroxyproline dehydrogenase subunit beta
LRQALKADVAVVGAGILGLAHAYLAARSGLSVAVFERNPAPQGASLRNFGMIWPIGQPGGSRYRLALRSRSLWLEALRDAGLHYRETGSIHAAYAQDEAAVGAEFASKAPSLGIDCAWLPPEEVLARSHALCPDGLLGGLWSAAEMIVDPRQVMHQLPKFLADELGVQFYWNTPVQRVDGHKLKTPEHRFEANYVLVCGGDDFQTLFPECFRENNVTRCKLQMMRTVRQPNGWLLGPSLAFGLTFLHYPAFEICESRHALRERIARELPEFARYGIHLLVSQTASGELTLGDSHEYSLAVNVFDNPAINHLILEFARRRLQIPALHIQEHWHGVYASHATHPWLTFAPADDVRVLTVTSGIGMTMSFALAEQTMSEMGVPIEAAESRSPSANRIR